MSDQVQAWAEVALRESQARLAGIVNSAMAAIITVDEEQRIVLFNHAAELMFRCSAAEALGQSLNRFIPARFRGAHAQHIHTFERTGVTTRAMAGARDVSALRADGEEFPVEASISQVEANGQKLFTVILRDITERKRAEERFRQLIEHAPNGMVMVDQTGKIMLVNMQIEKSFGYSRDELLGQSIEMLVPERFRAPDGHGARPLRLAQRRQRVSRRDRFESACDRTRADGLRHDCGHHRAQARRGTESSPPRRT